MSALPPRPPRPSVRVPNYQGKPNVPTIVMATDIAINLDEVRGQQIAVLGMSGSGKSQTVRRFAEQLHSLGVASSIIDIENEYAGLKEIGSFIVAGPQIDYGKIHIDVPLTNDSSYYALARRAYRDNQSVILLLQELDDDVRKIHLAAYLKGLFDEGRDPDHRHTHAVVIEEAQEYIPQTGIDKKDALRNTLLRIAKRGRKRGLWPIVVSQRPANVDKDFLTQSRLFLAHFVSYPNDVATYKTLFAEHMTGEELGTHVKQMTPGDVIYMNGRGLVRSHILPPMTESPSETPGAVHVESFKTVTNLEEMRESIAREASNSKEMDDSLETLPVKEVREMRERLRAQDEEIAATKIYVGNLEDSNQSKTRLLTQLQGSGDHAMPTCPNCATMQAKINKAEAEAAPVRILLSLMESHMRKDHT